MKSSNHGLIGQVLASRLDNLLFGDYTVPDLLQEERTYREVADIAQLDQVVLSYIVDYNNTNKTGLNLILFQLIYSFHSFMIDF